ncbi:recombinase family protein [Sphingopyxis sp. NFH-91]|uniref:recombinase family protein n=1 Tax=Sphingopyxis sp. NFH-91 TaxID=2744457 RepID=UPI001F1F74F6|nr:recombinase family protein [Sphingopyxis sp. NFH-91]
MADYVAYYRVSTTSQGRSGLGLAAQKSKVQEFLSVDDRLIGEFVEVQSGKSDDRTELWKAIASAKKHSAKIIIAKLDRFSRKVSFIAGIMEQGISLVVAEMPNATDFQLHIFAALAQEERRLISERTRAALAEAKKRGVILGSNGRVLAERNRQKALETARQMEPVIRPLLDAGHSYSAIARILNDQGLASSKGGRFHPQTIKNIAIKFRKRSAECISSQNSGK